MRSENESLQLELSALEHQLSAAPDEQDSKYASRYRVRWTIFHPSVHRKLMQLHVPVLQSPFDSKEAVHEALEDLQRRRIVQVSLHRTPSMAARSRARCPIS